MTVRLQVRVLPCGPVHAALAGAAWSSPPAQSPCLWHPESDLPPAGYQLEKVFFFFAVALSFSSC